MFNATVAGTSNHKFRLEKLKDTALDMRGSEHGVNRTEQQTNSETEQQTNCCKNYKTPLYFGLIMLIMLLIILSIIYVALGGLQWYFMDYT
jgi:hypothetical protein